MAQLDYMEKRGSGLKRIYNETKALEGYKEDLKPVFKSTTSQFMTIIYSVEYDAKGNEIIATKPEISKEHVVTKQSLSSHKVIVKLSLSIPNISELLQKMVAPMSAKDMRKFCGLKDSTYFKANVIDPLIAEGLVAMTHPDSPKSPTQKYYLTELGTTLIANEAIVPATTLDEIQNISNLIANLTKDEKSLVLDLLQKKMLFPDSAPKDLE